MAFYHLYIINPEPGKILVNYKAGGAINHIRIDGYSTFDMYDLHPGFSYDTDSTDPIFIQNFLTVKFFGDNGYDPVILNLNPNPVTGEIRGRSFSDYIQMPSAPPVVSKSFYLIYTNPGFVPQKTLGQWNSFFGTTTISSFEQQNDKVTFTGPIDISLPDSCFKDDTYIKEVVDETGSISSIGVASFQGSYMLETITLSEAEDISIGAFVNCSSLVILTFPKVKTIGDGCFYGCSSNFTLLVPELEHLGSNAYDNNVFHNISGRIVNITLPHAIMICNDGGKPDGDIESLQKAGNMVTITET